MILAAVLAGAQGWILPTLGNLALVALGVWLAPWRAFRGKAIAQHATARPWLALPLLIGFGLYLGMSFVVDDLQADGTRPLWILFGMIAVLAPPALFGLFEDLGARDMNVRGPFARLGLATRAWLRAFPLLAGAGGLIATIVHLSGGRLGTMDEVVVRAHGGEFVLVALLGVFVLPLLEESLFRGRLLVRFTGHLGPERANLVQAILFGLLHGLAASPVLAAFGWLLGRARLAGAGLGTLALVHALHNALVFLFLARR